VIPQLGAAASAFSKKYYAPLGGLREKGENVLAARLNAAKTRTKINLSQQFAQN